MPEEAGRVTAAWRALRAYCACVGSHKPGCPNDVPGGMPPLSDDDD